MLRHLDGLEVEMAQRALQVGAAVRQRQADVAVQDALVRVAVQPRVLPRMVDQHAAVAQHELAEAARQRHGQQRLGRDFAKLVEQAHIVQRGVAQLVEASEAVRHALVQKAQAGGQAVLVHAGAQGEQCVVHLGLGHPPCPSGTLPAAGGQHQN